MSFIQASMGGRGSSSLAELEDVNIESPQEGDILVYDTESGKWINEAKSFTITVTLTVNGALEDTITIKDSDNNTVGTCIFANSSTSGTCIVDILPDTQYTFISSVAVNPNNWSESFSINKTLTDSIEQTVNVYPDNTLLWYGNQVIPFGAYADFYYSSGAFVPRAPGISLSGRQIAISCPSEGSWRSYDFRTVNKIDLSNFTKFKFRAYRKDNCTSGAATSGYCTLVARQNMSGYYDWADPKARPDIDGEKGTGNQVIPWKDYDGNILSQCDIGTNPPYSGEYYICIWLCPNWQQATDIAYIDYLVLD